MEVTKISGNDVPIDTIVKPITTSGIPPLLASPLAPSMKKSADTTNKPSARRRIKTVIGILFPPKLRDNNWLPIIPRNNAPSIKRVLNCSN